jgi:hypothetical protein
VRVAVAQLDPKLGEKQRNLEACLARLEDDYELYFCGDRRPELLGALVEEALPIKT